MWVYAVVVGAIAVYAGAHRNINKTEKRKKLFLLFAFGLLLFVAALRSEAVGRDLAGHYANNFRSISDLRWNSLRQFSITSGYEFGYVLFCKILSLISSNVQWFILVVSSVILGIQARFIYKMSKDVVFSTFLFVFSCTYYMFLTMIRQALAISIILIGFEILMSKMSRSKRYLYFLLSILLAMCFHQSAILGIVFIAFDLLKFRRLYIIIATIGTVIFYFLYDKVYAFMLHFMGNSERYAAHVTSEAEGVGSIDTIGLINIVLTFGAFFVGYYALIWCKKRYLKKENIDCTDKNVVYKIEHDQSMLLYASLMAGVFRLMATQMNILNRVTYYFLPFIFIMYPLGTQNSGKCKEIFKYGIYLLYLGYFVIVTYKVAGSYYGTVPYLFFWQS